jgi:uncharacterized protein (TIGR03083 family)
MNPYEQLARLRTESAHIAALAAGRDLGVPAPFCPEMTVGEVIRHLGSVYRRVTRWVHDQAPPESWEDSPAGEHDLIEWFADASRVLDEELRDRPPEDPCDGWMPEPTVGAWWRRMAHETTVHRVDVETAFGLLGPVEAAFAVDGVDEVLSIFLARPPRDHNAGRESPAHDGTGQAGTAEDGENTADRDTGWIVGVSTGSTVWRVERGPASFQVSREIPFDADAVVMGDPASIYLWLWGRQSGDVLRVNGDPAAAVRLRAALAAATVSDQA